MERFLIVQGSVKNRVIDNASRSGHNEAMPEPLAITASAVIREVLRIGLPDATWETWAIAEIREALPEWLDLQVFVCDLLYAYRQVPIRAERVVHHSSVGPGCGVAIRCCLQQLPQLLVSGRELHAPSNSNSSNDTQEGGGVHCRIFR